MGDCEAKAEMLIHRSVRSGFDAFVDPGTITEFWLESASGPLESGAVVTWNFMVEGAKETVKVMDVVEDKLIAFDWSDGIHVRITFADLGYKSMRVAIVASGFETPKDAISATEGFAIVLCDLKTFLESGRSAQLVRGAADLIERDRRADPSKED